MFNGRNGFRIRSGCDYLGIGKRRRKDQEKKLIPFVKWFDRDNRIGVHELAISGTSTILRMG